MTDRSQSAAPHAGAPFGAMLRGALLPSLVAGLVAVVARGRLAAARTRSRGR